MRLNAPGHVSVNPLTRLYQAIAFHVQPLHPFQLKEIHKPLHPSVPPGDINLINNQPTRGNPLLNLLPNREHNRQLHLQRPGLKEVQVPSALNPKTTGHTSTRVPVRLCVLEPG